MFEEVQAKALKRALAEQLEESMQAAKLTKLDMAKKMATSRSQLDRVLDPSNVSVQLDTLIKAARALGKEIEIKIKRAIKKEAPERRAGQGACRTFATNQGVVGSNPAGRATFQSPASRPTTIGRE
jgi:antitoxin HicB